MVIELVGLGFGVWGLGLGVWGLGFGVLGLGCGVRGLGFSYEGRASHSRQTMTVRSAPRLYIACSPRRITRIILELGAVPNGTVLNLRTTTSQKCEAVPRRARM